LVEPYGCLWFWKNQCFWGSEILLPVSL